MEKPNGQVTLNEHINQISDCFPPGTRVSFECRVKWDKKQQAYVVQGDNYYNNSILLRFSVTTPKESEDGRN